MKKIFILLLLTAWLSYPVICSFAQTRLTSSTSLSFTKSFPSAEATCDLEESGIIVNITVKSRLTYRGNVILFTESPLRHTEAGNSTTVKSTVSTAFSQFELDGQANVSIDYYIGSLDGPMYPFRLEHAVLEKVGVFHSISMEEYMIFNGHIPVLGVHISIFMRPVATYTPFLRGDIKVEGPATVSPSSLSWNQGYVTYLLQFSESEPVSLTLSNPTLVLDNLNFALEFYAIVTSEGVYAPPVFAVNPGDYSMSSPTASLITFEPDYYRFYSELKESYADISSELQDTQNSLNELTNEVALLRDEISSLAPSLQNLLNRIDNLEKEDPLSSNLTSLENQVQTLSANWENLADSVGQLTDEINAMTIEVNAVDRRLYEMEQSSIVAIAFVASLISIVISATSLWKAFNNKE